MRASENDVALGEALAARRAQAIAMLLALVTIDTSDPPG